MVCWSSSTMVNPEKYDGKYAMENEDLLFSSEYIYELN